MAKEAKKPEQLTSKQEQFCREYLIDRNGKQAAIRAGYSPATAEVQASRLLSNAKVREFVDRMLTEVSAKTQITVEFVLNGLVENYNRAMQAEPVLNNDGVPTGEYKYQGQVANKSLELLGRYLKMFVDRHEHTGKDGAPLSHLTDEQLIAIATGSGARTS